MAQDIVGSLFGMQQQPDYYMQDQRAAIDLANLQSPKAMGRYFGAMIGAPVGRAAVQGLMSAAGFEDPRLKRQKLIATAQQQGLDPSTPEGAKQIAEFFRQNGDLELATRASMLANQMMESQATVQAKTREKLGSPESQAEQVILNQLKEQYGEIEGSNRFYSLKQQGRIATAAAGAAQYGQEKIGNLSGAQGIVEKYTKQPFERLQAIDEAKGFLGMANEGNTAAVPQLRRALVRLGGPDSQLAAREIASIAGNAGIVGNVANAVNNFFTGTPTKEEIKLIGKVIAGAEGVIADQYTQGRQQAETVLGAARLDPQTREALLPPAFKKAESKKQAPNAPKVGTIQQGYRFKGGNPADPKNWEQI